jgi:hypothetical protein
MDGVAFVADDDDAFGTYVYREIVSGPRNSAFVIYQQPLALG